MPDIEQDGPVVDLPQSNATLPTSEPINTGVLPVATDTTEQEAETDEQKNERELKEREERTQKRAQGVQKRMDELTRDKYAERAAREAAERLNAELLTLLKGGKQQEAATADGPQRAQFDDYEKYLEARQEWLTDRRVENRLAREKQAWEQQAQRRVVEQQANQIATSYQQKLAETRVKIPDFDQIIQDNSDVETGNAAPAIATSDNPAALLVYFAQNPAVAERLAVKSPVEAAREVGKIEAMLAAKPQLSNAPPPGKPVGARGGGTKDLAKMDYDEFVKARRAQIARRR